MSNLTKIYNKNATVKNGGITAFIATASNEDDQFEYLWSYLAKAKIAFIFIAIFYSLLAIGALLTLRQFLRFHVVYSDLWKAFVEFPVIHHACHVIRKFYSVSVVLNLCLFSILGFVLYADGINSVIGMFIGGILAIVAIVYSAIVAWFVQVYQIMIALEIFNGLKNSDEQLMGPELEVRQMKKKKRIRSLYKILLLRDFVVIPAFVIYDSYQVFADVQSGKSISFLGSGVTMAVFMLTTTSIYLSVPLSMAFYLVNKMGNPEIRKNLNPLQRIIFCQAILISVSVMTSLVVSFTFFFCDVIPFNFVSSAIQVFGLLLPVSIMQATLISSPKIEKEQVSMSANLCKVEPFAIANDMEKPPIQNSY
ncbi:hypothetical protein L5515_006391 [Caenorhabditis briggsae]|uniref:Uncharacterized protein n=1 Tax=Caenorhabditis briggsae TaxID=6238 RepID=A0AAE9JJY3_CAEBR|nr:hypothetical protein L5515_006391 [Caenorhabditis briggsae]